MVQRRILDNLIFSFIKSCNMKKVLFLLFAVFLVFQAIGQIDRTPAYYTLTDTTTNSETIYATFTGSQIRPFMDAIATWQVAVTGISDTTTYSIFIEETLDKSNSPVWVVTDTICTAQTTLAADYWMHDKVFQGYRQRLKIVATGTSTTAQFKVWATIRKKTWGGDVNGY